MYNVRVSETCVEAGMKAVCPMPCGRSENMLGGVHFYMKNQSLADPVACVDTPLTYHNHHL